MSQKRYLGGSLLHRKCLSIQCLHDFEWIKDISSQENFQLLLELILVSINDFSAKCKKCRQISKEASKKMLSEDQTQNVLSSTQVLNQNKSATTRKYKHEKHKTLIIITTRRDLVFSFLIPFLSVCLRFLLRSLLWSFEEIYFTSHEQTCKQKLLHTQWGT